MGCSLIKQSGFVAIKSAPINDSTVFNTKDEIKEKELAEKMRNEMASVNMREVLAFLDL